MDESDFLAEYGQYTNQHEDDKYDDEFDAVDEIEGKKWRHLQHIIYAEYEERISCRCI